MEDLKPYPKYQTTKLNWLNQVPIDWDIKRTAALFHEKKTLNKEYQFKQAFQFKFGEIVNKKQIGTQEELKETYQKYTIVDKDDIVINGLNLNYDFLTQRVGKVRERGIITSAYISISPQKEEIEPRYACYLLKTLDNRKMLNGMGTGIRLTLSFPELKKQYLPLPPLSEQIQIANYLDYKVTLINKFIKDKKKEIILLKEQKQAEINQVVTKGINPDIVLVDSGLYWLGMIPEHWKVKRLKTFCDFVNRGCTPNYTENISTKVVNQATFSKGYWDLKKVRYTTTNPIDNRGLLQQNDILIASTGGGVLGKTYLFSENDTYIADSHVTVLRDSKQRFIPKFLYYYFSINYDLINGILAQGSTNQTELQREWLRSLKFAIPAIEEQQIIVNYLTNIEERIDRAISAIENEITLIQDYKISLISDVVTGKVDVRNIAIENTEDEPEEDVEEMEDTEEIENSEE